MRIVSIAHMLAVLAVASPAAAFHDGGAAACAGCHLMHESDDGMPVVAGEGLLLGESPTDVCLSCHAAANGAVFAFDPLHPAPERGGGNFVFLLEDDIDDEMEGPPGPVRGEAAGHSVVAPSVGLFPDTRWASAPGGTFPSAALGCTSCHDPHGTDSFRMLHGAGPVQDGLFTFTTPPPGADGAALNGAPESVRDHTAYLSGWSAWCGNCHGARYHEMGTSAFVHPGDAPLDEAEAERYRLYAGDAFPTGGTPATAYLPEVPFEDPSMTTSSTLGPGAGSRVSCITCHRAHATSSPAAGRWDFRVRRLADDGALSGSYPLPSPYPGDPEQGELCLKCHEAHTPSPRSCVSCHTSGR